MRVVEVGNVGPVEGGVGVVERGVGAVNRHGLLAGSMVKSTRETMSDTNASSTVTRVL
jgi:hypothetical protein